MQPASDSDDADAWSKESMGFKFILFLRPHFFFPNRTNFLLQIVSSPDTVP